MGNVNGHIMYRLCRKRVGYVENGLFLIENEFFVNVLETGRLPGQAQYSWPGLC